MATVHSSRRESTETVTPDDDVLFRPALENSVPLGAIQEQ
jgi:hypothetical protein